MIPRLSLVSRNGSQRFTLEVVIEATPKEILDVIADVGGRLPIGHPVPESEVLETYRMADQSGSR